MNYFELLKEIDQSLEKQVKDLQETNWVKRHVVCDRLKSALVHIKRELRSFSFTLKKLTLV